MMSMVTDKENDSLWPGCLFDSHCHLNLVHRWEYPVMCYFGQLMWHQFRKLELAQGLPRGSLITLQDSLRRYISILDKHKTLTTTLYRDGQSLEDDAVGGVVTNLHQPRDWWLYDQFVKKFPGEKRVFFAIGCHPKQATLLTPANLMRLEELVQQPGVVAVGECGLDYSAR